MYFSMAYTHCYYFYWNPQGLKIGNEYLFFLARLEMSINA